MQWVTIAFRAIGLGSFPACDLNFVVNVVLNIGNRLSILLTLVPGKTSTNVVLGIDVVYSVYRKC